MAAPARASLFRNAGKTAMLIPGIDGTIDSVAMSTWLHGSRSGSGFHGIRGGKQMSDDRFRSLAAVGCSNADQRNIVGKSAGVAAERIEQDRGEQSK